MGTSGSFLPSPDLVSLGESVRHPWQFPPHSSMRAESLFKNTSPSMERALLLCDCTFLSPGQHGIPEWFGLGKALKIILFQIPAVGRDTSR